MAATFMLLRPEGNGYQVLPSGRQDTPMFTVRVFPGVTSPDYSVQFGTLESRDYHACIVGMNFDAEISVTNVSMELGYDDFWALTWNVSDPLGSNAYFDVLFISRGMCTTVDQDTLIFDDPC